MIEWNRVAELKKEVGADAFDEVVDLFLEEVEEVIARLRGTTDRTNLTDDLHFLKGSALNLGFEAFATQCGADEKRAARQGVDSVDLVALVDCYMRSREKFLAGLDAVLAVA
ncbi:Hpt domain-containing protein [Actibacterium sp. D379-3]